MQLITNNTNNLFFLMVFISFPYINLQFASEFQVDIMSQCQIFTIICNFYRSGCGYILLNLLYSQLTVCWHGWLPDGKLISKQTTPFGLKLGDNNVIRGFDIGIEGEYLIFNEEYLLEIS